MSTFPMILFCFMFMELEIQLPFKYKANCYLILKYLRYLDRFIGWENFFNLKLEENLPHENIVK